MTQNTQPISFDEFISRINNKVHQTKNYYSIYITPKGEILDCRYPIDLGHNDFSIEVYKNLDELPADVFNSCLRGLHVPFKEVPYYLEKHYNLLDVYYEDMKLYWSIDKELLGTEERICQDMGFIKVCINDNLKSYVIMPPNTLFNKKVTAAQYETIENISDYFCVDLCARLKAKQKENAQIAAQIKSVLNKIQNSSV